MLWNMKLTLFQQKRIFIMNEILAAWQYMEVYLIAIVLGVLQIGGISKGLIGGACDKLEDSLEMLAKWGWFHEEDATCFQVTAEIMDGTYVLLAAAILLNIACQIVVKAAASAMEDRIQNQH